MPDTVTSKLIWLDAEMTGLDPQVDELVEVAVQVTGYDLTPLDQGFHVVIKPSDESLAQMTDFVREMHTASGLIDDIPNGVSLAQAEKDLLDYIYSHVPVPQSAPLAGNTIGTDRAFLQHYMPSVHEHLHYRNIDVSTIKELARHWFPKTYFHAPEKKGGHRAPADILESIRELAYYRKAVFLSEPGLSTSDLKKVSSEVSETFAGLGL